MAGESSSQRSRRWRQENRERYLTTGRARAKKWRQDHPQERAARDRLRTTGWSWEQYNAALVLQAGLCCICLSPMTGIREPAADHNHKTKSPRGLLCTRCNTGLGLFLESPDLLRRAEAYLASF